MAYSLKHLRPAAATNFALVKRAMGMLAFADVTAMPSHRSLFSDDRWDALRADFAKANRTIYGIAPEPRLVHVIRAGLSALRTNQCGHPDTAHPKCPACDPHLQRLAAHLPVGHHVRSRLVCRLSGQIMDENNPPMAMPNGSVYSLKALEAMHRDGGGGDGGGSGDSSGGMLRCPRTGFQCRFEDLRKIFVL